MTLSSTKVKTEYHEHRCHIEQTEIHPLRLSRLKTIVETTRYERRVRIDVGLHTEPETAKTRGIAALARKPTR